MQVTDFGRTMQKQTFDFCTGPHGLQTWGYWCGDVLLATARGPDGDYKSTEIWVAPDVDSYIGHGYNEEKRVDLALFYDMLNEHKVIHWNVDFKTLRSLLIPEHWGSES